MHHTSPREKKPPHTLSNAFSATSKKETPPAGDTGEHHFSQRAGKLIFKSYRTTETNTHLQSREQQQRNMNSETKTQILAHKMRHKNTKRSATRAANGMAFHKTADEWQRLTHFSVGRSRSASQQSAACHCTLSSELPSWSPALHRWVHTDVGARGQHEVMLGLHEQLNHDGVWTTYLQHLDVFRGDLDVPVLPVLADHHHRQL